MELKWKDKNNVCMISTVHNNKNVWLKDILLENESLKLYTVTTIQWDYYIYFIRKCNPKTLLERE